MCKKVICPISVLLLALLASLAEGADPNLVGLWRFDEGSGTTTVDSSGHGNDAILVAGATWATGRFGGGIKLDGTSGYVSIPDFELTTDTITFAIWLNGWKAANWAPLISSREFTACEMNFGDNNTLHYTWNNDSYLTYNWTGGPIIPQDTWTMLAVTIDPTGATAYVYTDADGLKQATNEIAHYEQTVGALQIGYSYGTRYVRGIVDEAAVFSRALTKEEILGLASGIGGGYPYVLNPYPADGEMIAETWVELSWKPGDFAVSHDVYLSDNFDDVNAGAAGAFQSNQADASYIAGLPGLAYPDGLVAGTTYYWRIDEVNEADPNSPWKGPVWSFWIPPK
ncbi:MAG TPA: LamG domain-containing protein, partial [Sedimentisphaerales bacterium]|nr:LamG domain-containing protein [Sedimentisphaerales bacterium]